MKKIMNREESLKRLNAQSQSFDFIVIGGGATGIGVALEAITRGYSVLLLEKSDFTKSTSSKSTKLVHGGVRYLAQGDVALVREACVERGRLHKNAPHLVRNQSFIIPTFGLKDEVMYTAGLTLYDLMASGWSLGHSKRISKTKTLKRIKNLKADKLSAGVVYHDGQFDDTRLAINVLQTASEQGATVLNYMSVTGLEKDGERISGVKARDEESGKTYTFQGKTVVNATGVFADNIMKMDRPGMQKTIKPSQGVHLVLDRSFLPGNDALMIPKTDDGRVLFAVPWHNKIVLGTTDTPIESASLEPVALEQEIEFILKTAEKYLAKAPKREDVLSVFSGLRPLAASNGSGKTKEISRSHKIMISESGLMTMIGGKWTTFRKMAEDLVDKAEQTFSWAPTASKTKDLKIHGYKKNVDRNSPLFFYGSDEAPIRALVAENPELGETLSESLGVIKAQVVWAARHEMACTVEDFLARRTRCQLLDAKESIKMAPIVAELMAAELDRSEDWVEQQIEAYIAVTKNYVLDKQSIDFEALVA